jgi:hypothetical protein
MKLKRLKHQSYILCHMFCGWQLYPDWERLAQLGDGVLEIDVLEETCKFNSETIPRLSIVGALRNWLLHDLETNKIPIKNIESAKLTVRLRAGFEKRTEMLNYNHDFLLEGIIVGNGREFKTKLEDKNGRQKIIET